MAVPTLITELSTTAASNAPAGADSPSTLDDIQRAHAAFIAQLRDNTGFTTAKAASGANSDITSLTGLTTALSIAQGGTSAATANAAADALGAFRRGTVLGTVSQTAGVPTGAVIERGSNANGEYVRYADGTQICRRDYVGWVGSNVNNTLPLPAAFTGEAAMTWNTVPAENVYAVSACWIEAGEWRWRHATASTTQVAYLAAIGRWF